MITHKMLNKKFHGDTPTKPHRSGDSALSWGASKTHHPQIFENKKGDMKIQIPHDIFHKTMHRDPQECSPFPMEWQNRG